MVSPSAARPASTSETEARRSVAITGAPFNLATPRIAADAPCTLMSAPMRVSCGTCMKRFSKLFSVMTESPSAVLITAIICAWRSVGKPGNGAVATSMPLSRPLAADLDALVAALDGDAAALENLRRRRDHVVAGADELDLAAGDRRRHHVSAGLDPVGDDGVHGAVQALDAFDADAVGAGATDVSAHSVEAEREVGNLRLARGIDDRALANRERSRHHRVLGGADRNHRKDDLGAAQALWCRG